MWTSFKCGICLVLSSVMPGELTGQECALTLKGHILDRNTGDDLPFAVVYFERSGKGVVADEGGYFRVGDLCPGTYRIQFSHIGCEPLELDLNLLADTSLTVHLDHQSEQIGEVVIHADRERKGPQISQEVNRDQIVRTGNKDLSEIIGSVQGVSILQTGAGISKPVLHGMYGNRLTILNSGIAQSGQQWGNDHAPEIDPFVAERVSVVKGAGALQYSGKSLGGIIVIDPGRIPVDSNLNGTVNYIVQSNGRGQTLNTHLERTDRLVAWRVTGTAKLRGDMRSPGYVLTNTGKREGDLAVQVERSFRKKWHTELYYSMFYTNIGILRGAHIGNTTDLEEALTRPVPFYTGEETSFSISSPRQEVSHHLLKLQTEGLVAGRGSVRLTYGGQIDNRREYDVRRGGRSDIPALSLLQNSQFGEVTYDVLLGGEYSLKSGLQFDYVDNANDPETGILPLIPDYRSYTTSGFLILKHEGRRLHYELGSRYDAERINVWAISRTTPREIRYKSHVFHDYGFSVGMGSPVANWLNLKTSLDYYMRAPEVNELYSFGLHQGVSGIEKGNPGLKPESSVKYVLSTDWKAGKNLNFEALGYVHDINRYIYLQPAAELELTIRGAFPVFNYEQSDALIYGTDLMVSYDARERLKVVAKYAALKGINRSEDLPLLYMPADNLSCTGTYRMKAQGKVGNSTLSVTGRYVFRQRNYVEGQDYLPPPDAYFLLGVDAETSLQVCNAKNLRISFQAENLLNRKYRDYLNRLRYFADEPGKNFVLNLSYEF